MVVIAGSSPDSSIEIPTDLPLQTETPHMPSLIEAGIEPTQYVGNQEQTIASNPYDLNANVEIVPELYIPEALHQFGYQKNVLAIALQTISSLETGQNNSDLVRTGPEGGTAIVSPEGDKLIEVVWSNDNPTGLSHTDLGTADIIVYPLSSTGDISGPGTSNHFVFGQGDLNEKTELDYDHLRLETQNNNHDDATNTLLKDTLASIVSENRYDAYKGTLHHQQDIITRLIPYQSEYEEKNGPTDITITSSELGLIGPERAFDLKISVAINESVHFIYQNPEPNTTIDHVHPQVEIMTSDGELLATATYTQIRYLEALPDTNTQDTSAPMKVTPGLILPDGIDVERSDLARSLFPELNQESRWNTVEQLLQAAVTQENVTFSSGIGRENTTIQVPSDLRGGEM